MKLFDGRPDDDLSHPIVDDETAVYDFLDNIGLKYKTLTHPAAFTMEECEEVRKMIGVPVFKNLFLTNKQQSRFFLLMMPAWKPFMTKYLSSQINCSRLWFATSVHLKEFLHIMPGAVSPMGLIHDKDKRVKPFLIKNRVKQNANKMQTKETNERKI